MSTQSTTINPTQTVWVPEWCQVKRWRTPKVKIGIETKKQARKKWVLNGQAL